MARAESYEAIVLKTYDVGEADRLCICFTRERGRLAARARGARKPQSHMGGSLLPMQHVVLSLKESSAGAIVTGAELRSAPPPCDVSSFLELERGMEMLLCLLHDEDSLPEVFDLTLRFLQRPRLLPFAIHLLHLMGLVSLAFFGPLPDSEKQFIQICLSSHWGDAPVLAVQAEKNLAVRCASVIFEQSGRVLRSTAVEESVKMA